MHVPWVLSTSKILTDFTEQHSLLFGKYMNHSRKNLYKHKPNQERDQSVDTNRKRKNAVSDLIY
jgi:hypothetical protein